MQTQVLTAEESQLLKQLKTAADKLGCYVVNKSDSAKQKFLLYRRGHNNGIYVLSRSNLRTFVSACKKALGITEEKWKEASLVTPQPTKAWYQQGQYE